MSLITKSKTKNEVTFNAEELELLLKLIADSKFDGKDVQVVYSSAVKLQKLLTD